MGLSRIAAYDPRLACSLSQAITVDECIRNAYQRPADAPGVYSRMADVLSQSRLCAIRPG